MSYYEQWSAIRGRFDRKTVSEHFVVYFFDRHPGEGRMEPVHGVRDRRLVSECIAALERSYRALARELGAEPLFAPDGLVPVYLFSVGDCFDGDDHLRCAQVRELYFTSHKQIYPAILLPSRSRDATFEAELQTLRASAAHELAHVFNARRRWGRRIVGGVTCRWRDWEKWTWLNEGLAVRAERLVCPAIREWFGFVREWVDRPEMPLDYSGYAAGMFAHYLAVWGTRQGVQDLPRRMWTPSPAVLDEVECPLDLPFIGSDRIHATVPRTFKELNAVFGEFFLEYCSDGWFIADENVWPDGLHEVGLRFHERGLSGSAALHRGPRSIEDPIFQVCWSLDHLACRYFRFIVSDVLGCVTIVVTISEETPSDLRATISHSACLTAHRQSTPVELQPESDNPRILRARVDGVDPTMTSCLILTVANCGTRDRADSLGDHDDGRQFSITVECK